VEDEIGLAGAAWLAGSTRPGKVVPLIPLLLRCEIKTAFFVVTRENILGRKKTGSGSRFVNLFNWFCESTIYAARRLFACVRVRSNSFMSPRLGMA
jgi:hypothetical protein